MRPELRKLYYKRRKLKNNLKEVDKAIADFTVQDGDLVVYDCGSLRVGIFFRGHIHFFEPIDYVPISSVAYPRLLILEKGFEKWPISKSIFEVGIMETINNTNS